MLLQYTSHAAPTPNTQAESLHKTGVPSGYGGVGSTDLHIGVEVGLAPGLARVVGGEHVGLGRWNFVERNKIRKTSARIVHLFTQIDR